MWRGREIEVRELTSEDGKLTLIQDGGEQPSAQWRHNVFLNRFARTLVRYYLEVNDSEVTEVHHIDAEGDIDGVRVRLIAEDDFGRLAVESASGAARNFLDGIVEKYGLEYFHDSIRLFLVGCRARMSTTSLWSGGIYDPVFP